MVCGKNTAGSYNSQNQLFYCFGITKQTTWYYTRESSSTYNVLISSSGNNIAWYDTTGAYGQLNVEATQYQYTAIG